MKSTDEPIIVEQHFNAPVREVWKAITEVNRMTRWFFENIEAFKPETGFETRFNVTTPNGDFLHLWKLTEVIPLKKITCNWKYEGYPGDSFVSFELFEKDNGAILRLTHEVTETFPQHIPEFTRESCTGGWNYFIGDRLSAFLEKNSE